MYQFLASGPPHIKDHLWLCRYVQTQEHIVEIVGGEGAEGVHTIDMWFSSRRQCWIVERRDPEGSIVGPSFCTSDERDAASCLVEWLRSHDDTHLVGRPIRTVTEVEDDGK